MSYIRVGLKHSEIRPSLKGFAASFANEPPPNISVARFLPYKRVYLKGCRMPSISGMAEIITRLESPNITVHQDRCVLVRNRNAGCFRCANACVSGCISFDGESMHVDLEKCVGCGTCATACPTSALEAQNPDDVALITQCSNAGELLGGKACIACRNMLARAHGLYDVDKVIRVECLGRVDESLLTILAASGLESVTLVRGDCETCELKAGAQLLDEVLATENTLLSTWGSRCQLNLSDKLPSAVRAIDEGYDKERRALFKRGRANGIRLGMVATDVAVRNALGNEEPGESGEHPWCTYAKATVDGVLPHAAPERRIRLLDALSELGEPADELVSTRLWGHVIIDVDKCSSCRMCATFCPTGALALFEEDSGTFGVSHYPGLCVKCRCCENICPSSAIEISEEVFAVDILAGEVERYAMRPRTVKPNQQHAMLNAMRSITKAPHVYEVGD